MTLTDITEDDFTSAGDAVAAIIASATGDRITDIDVPAHWKVLPSSVSMTPMAHGSTPPTGGVGWNAFGVVNNNGRGAAGR